MEIVVQRNDLARELQLVQGIVERKSSIPILSNVLCEARAGELRIAATDLDVSLRCGCSAQVEEEGAVTLAAKKLYEIVRSLPENEVKLELEKDAWARIRCGSVEFRMAGLPRELMESARIDGASDFEIFLKIVLPLSLPVLASFAIFQFLWVWNDLLVAMVFLGSGADQLVLTGKLNALLGSRGGDWEILTTSAFVTIVVPLAVFFSLQRYFVRGLLAGSVKGG